MDLYIKIPLNLILVGLGVAMWIFKVDPIFKTA